MLTVYVAGGWVGRDSLLEPMKILEDNGFNVNSTWIQRETGNDHPHVLNEDAKVDIEEVTASDIIVAFMESHCYAYRGTFCEIGCALGQDKPVIIICPGKYEIETDTKCKYDFYCMRLPFFWHPNIIHAENFEEALKILMRIKENK